MQKKELEIDNFRDSPSSTELEQFKFSLQKYFTGYDLSLFEKIFRKALPISIFTKEVSPLETVVKYMKENLQFKNKDIALTLNISPQSLYHSKRILASAGKSPETFAVKLSKVKLFFVVAFSVTLVILGGVSAA